MSILPQLKPVAVADGVFQLSSFGARVTAIVHDGDLLLIDTGARGSWPLIARSLASLDLSSDRVRAVALTHSHPDHAGALGTIVNRTGASVCVHRADAEAIETHHPAAMLPPHLSRRMSHRLGHLMFGQAVEEAEHVTDGEMLDWPDDVQVVHTPGHTAGSISLFIPSLRLVIVGDALQYRFRKLAGPARWVTADYPMAVESMRRLTELDFETMVFGHFPPLERTAKERLQRLLEREFSASD